MILGTALTEQKELRSVVLQALRILISKTVNGNFSSLLYFVYIKEII